MQPSLTINNLTYRGYLEGKDMFDAICSSFSPMPAVCTDPFNQEITRVFSSAAQIDDNRSANMVR